MTRWLCKFVRFTVGRLSACTSLTARFSCHTHVLFQPFKEEEKNKTSSVCQHTSCFCGGQSVYDASARCGRSTSRDSCAPCRGRFSGSRRESHFLPRTCPPRHPHRGFVCAFVCLCIYVQSKVTTPRPTPVLRSTVPNVLFPRTSRYHILETFLSPRDMAECKTQCGNMQRTTNVWWTTHFLVSTGRLALRPVRNSTSSVCCRETF